MVWWFGASDTDRELLIRTVRTELQRLILEPESWVPGAIDARNPGEIRIVIRIVLDELGAEEHLLPAEEQAAKSAIERLVKQLDKE